MLFLIAVLKNYFSSNAEVAGGLDVLLLDLEFVHTLSQHNHSTLLHGSQHTYAWRVYGKGTMLFWYPNTAH